MNFAGNERSDACARSAIPAPMDGALDAIRRTMAYVNESAANCEAFARAPEEVLRRASAGLPPDDIERARLALEEVLRIARFDRATHAQALLGIAASVVRAKS
jgi:hypothetical protein